MASPLCALAICLAAGIPVWDGDTILRGPDRIRIAGIQAPELSEPGGIASRDHLRALVAGQPLACDSHGRDRYGRRVATCYLPDGRDIACAMVAAGHAADWPRYSKGAYARCGRE